MADTCAGEFLTIPEAAKLLKMSVVTIRRWIREGRLPAYQVGWRKVRIKSQDLARILTPRREVNTRPERIPPSTDFTPRPLTEAEASGVLAVLNQADALGQEMLARRRGKPLGSSAPLIRKARQERSQHLLK